MSYPFPRDYNRKAFARRLSLYASQTRGYLVTMALKDEFEKFLDLCSNTLDKDRSQELLQMIFDLDKLVSVADIVNLMQVR